MNCMKMLSVAMVSFSFIITMQAVEPVKQMFDRFFQECIQFNAHFNHIGVMAQQLNPHDDFHNQLKQQREQIAQTLNRQINTRRQTVLHIAVQCAHVAATELFLKLGANPNIPDIAGQTALHYAALLSQNDTNIAVSIISFLLFNNADPYLKDNQNRIPGDIAKGLAKRILQ